MNPRYLIIFIFIFSFFSCEDKENLDEQQQYMALIKDKLDCMGMPRPEGSYNYPILPGMERWKSFTTTEEMIDACQVPVAILKNQSTQAVFQALWEYPFFFEITYRYGHYQQDFETVFANTNAFKEFVTRKDAGECLYSRLTLVNPLYTIYSRGLELFVSQGAFLQQLSINKKKDIVSIALKNDSIRQAAVQYEGDVSRQITWLLIGRVLLSSNYKPFTDLIDSNPKLESFLETSALNVESKDEYDNFFQIIISNAAQFIH